MKKDIIQPRINAKFIKLAEKEMYKFWNKISAEIQGTYLVEVLLLTVLKTKMVLPDDVKYLYKVSTLYPESSITNSSGMPLLTIK